MGKKYLDIKKDSLEESILDIWQTAAEEAGTKMDGRTKGYKSHRSKLENRRTKREEKKASAKLDEARQLKDPKKEMLVSKGGKVITIDKKDQDDYLKKGWKVAESVGESVLRIWQTAAEAYEIGTDEYREYLERLTPGETIEEKGGDKEAYQKFFNSALKKFGVKSPAELEGDKKKEFFDYVDKNWTGDHEEAFEFAKKSKIDSMKEAIAKVWSFSEKVNKDKDEDKEVSGNKTLTGKKAAVVEIDPEPDLENRKKKKSGNPDH